MAEEQEGQMAMKTRRAEAERKQRRRRGGDTDNSALAVPEDVKRKLAEQGLEGRWINDLGNRMYQKTQLDDWDKVPGIEPVPVGVDRRTNEPIMAHYCAKPSEFLAEDNRRRMETLAAKEKGIFAGRDNGELDEGAYNPKGRNSISRSL